MRFLSPAATALICLLVIPVDIASQSTKRSKRRPPNTVTTRNKAKSPQNNLSNITEPSPPPEPLNLEGVLEPPSPRGDISHLFEPGPTWVYVGSVTDFSIFYHPRKVTYPAKSRVRAWVRFQFLNASRLPVTHKLFLYECDCEEERTRILESVVYGEKGKVLPADGIAPDWQFAAPDTVDAAILDTLCERMKALDELLKDVPKKKRNQ